MWSENRSNWSNRTKEICPFSLADKNKRFSAECVHENCAWYLAERGKCGVKVMAREVRKTMNGGADND